MAGNAYRIDEQADDLRLQTVTNRYPMTMLGWAKISTDRNAYSCIFSLNDDEGHATEYNELITESNGTSLVVYDHTMGSGVTVGTMTVGTWYKVAFVVLNGSFKAYFGTMGTPGVTLVANTSIANVSVNGYQGIGSTVFASTEWFNGCLSGVRAWNRELSESEIEAEFRSATPVATTDLVGAWLPPTMAAVDRYVAIYGTDLTEGNGGGTPTPSIESGPDLDPATGSVLSAAGAASVALVGQAHKSAVCSSAGVAAVAVVGRAEIRASVTAAGVAAVAAVGRSEVRAACASAGVASSSLVGGSSSGVGAACASAGVATVSMVGGSTVRAVASAAGVAAVAAVGGATSRAAASSAGVATVAAVGAASASAVLTSRSLTSGLLGYWPLDGNSLNEVTGASGVDTTVTYSAGKLGQGAAFNGSTSKIETAVDAPAGAAPRTVAAWFYPAALQSKAFCGYGTAVSQALFELMTWVDGTCLVNVWGTNAIATGVYTVGAWNHLAATYDGATVRAYLNNGTPGATAGTLASTPAAFAVGTGRSLYAFFNGSVDEVAVANRAWSAAEVAEHYNAGAGRALDLNLLVGASTTGASAVLSSAGVATVATVGASVATGAASAAGVATSSLAARSEVRASMTSAGVGAASLVGSFESSVGSALSAAGVASVAAVGASVAMASVSAAGVASVALVGSSTTGASAVASAAGVASVSMVGASSVASVVGAAGVATSSLVAGASVSASVSAAGAASVALVGSSVVGSESVLTVTGSASVAMVGASTVAAVASASGAATVLAVGSYSDGGSVAAFEGSGSSAALFAGASVAVAGMTGAGVASVVLVGGPFADGACSAAGQSRASVIAWGSHAEKVGTGGRLERTGSAPSSVSM